MGSFTNYQFDRRFTNYIHQNLATTQIYKILNWTEAEISREELELMDLNDGIDYVFTDMFGNFKYCQERFRESQYKRFNDFTIRFRRDYNPFEERKASEFSKIKAGYFIYGITNGNKQQFETNTDFIKYAVIDLDIVFMLLNNGRIEIDKSSKKSYIKGKIMYAGYNSNLDYSSSFIVLDIELLHTMFNEFNIIIRQKGFYKDDYI